MANAINWFEVPAANFERAVKFYGEIFDAQLHVDNIAGFTMGFFPAGEGGVGGAVVAGDGYVPGNSGSLVYLNAGNDLAEVLDRIPSSGGEVVVPKTLITEEIGYFAIFLDSEGNKMALHSRN